MACETSRDRIFFGDDDLNANNKDSYRQRFAASAVMITLASLVIAAAIIFLAMFRYTYGYMKMIDENGESVKYYHVGGKPYNGFKCINNYIYAFDENGVKITGKTEKDGKQYYFHTVESDGFFLFRNRDVEIDGVKYRVDGYGILRQAPRTGFYTAPDGYKYYYNEKGSRVTGRWLEIDGSTYYFQPVTGRMLVSEKAVINGITYVFDESGFATQIAE